MVTLKPFYFPAVLPVILSFSSKLLGNGLLFQYNVRTLRQLFDLQDQPSCIVAFLCMNNTQNIIDSLLIVKHVP